MDPGRDDLILCVDDDPEICEAVRTLLDGFRVLTANTGAQALALARRHPCNLTLLDYQLPDTNGLELCRAIRALDPYAPILIHSGRDVQHEAMAAGANAFIWKSVDPAELRHKIRWYVEKQHLASLSALVAVQGAMHEGLRQRLAVASARVGKAQRLIDRANERLVRLKAYRSFMEAGGSRADFATLWPQLVEGAAKGSD